MNPSLKENHKINLTRPFFGNGFQVKKYGKQRTIFLIIFCLTLGWTSVWAKTFKVEKINGRPQITMDGTPISPKMFYGYTSVTRAGVVPIDSEWKEVSFEFTAPETDNQAEVVFRVGDDPCEFKFDDFSVSDLTDSRLVVEDRFDGGSGFKDPWVLWTSGKSAPITTKIQGGLGRNGSGGLSVILGNSPETKGFHFFYKNIPLTSGHHYKVTIWAAAKGNKPLKMEVRHQGEGYRSYASLPLAFTREVQMAAEQNVPFVSLDVPICWTEEGTTLDFSQAFKACQEVLDANPKAYLIPRVSVEPKEWWRKLNGGHLVRFDDGQNAPYVSIASPKFKHEAGDALRRFIQALEAKFPDNIAGYHVTGQNTGEWFYPNAWAQRLSGDEEEMKNLWRARFESELPTPKERRMAGSSGILDPVKEKKIVDLNVFRQELMADTILEFAKIVKEETAGKRLTLFFYGYTFECSNCFHGPASSGHYAVRKILKSPDVDILLAPFSYSNRQKGGGGSCMSAAESIKLAGKLWLNEDDTCTYLASKIPFKYPGLKSGVDNVEDTLHLLRRNMGQILSRHFGYWWMDLGATGWFDDPVLWKDLGNFTEIEKSLSLGENLFNPEVSLVIDEKSMLLAPANGAVEQTLTPLIYESREKIGRAAFPYAQYLQDDVISNPVASKLFIFLNSNWVSKENVEAFKNSIQGKSVIWCWAPGYANEDGLSSKGITKLTGFEVKMMAESTLAHAKATEKGLAVGLPASFGSEKAIGTLFSVIPEKTDEVLGVLEDGSPAVVMRRNANGGVSLFCSVPDLPTELIRFVAKNAGVHLYANSDAHVWANGPLLSIHSTGEGSLDLNLPQKSKVFDLITGTVVGEGKTIHLVTHFGETRLFKVQKLEGGG
ncbi:MAG: hypothetical protein V4507_16325 [Verrucomicrobiota bacterium]